MEYCQLTAPVALDAYCTWLVQQLPEYRRSWYPLFYALRALLYGAELLQKPEYAKAAFPYFDQYVSEQLPNGAFNAKPLNRPLADFTYPEIAELLRRGDLNLADGGSNVHALLQAAAAAGGERRLRYLGAAEKWLKDWVAIFALPSGAYGNGFWGGHKLNGPYSMAMNVCSAFAAYTCITGRRDLIAYAENFVLFQLENGWHEAGVPVRFDNYPVPSADSLIVDYCRMFYLLEAICWTHYASDNESFRARVKERLDEWLAADFLPRWPEGQAWFNMDYKFPLPAGWRDSNIGTGFYWRAAKCNGIPYLFSYYLNHIGEHQALRQRFEAGVKYLSHPLDAMMQGVASRLELYLSVQATGIACLTLTEGCQADAAFAFFRREG
ncbi:MAG: hypothetical protein GX564_08985 [Oligosphaeraceae bacterium]|nr:hypothetical protein [Oligosphaeraceae bacterium]